MRYFKPRSLTWWASLVPLIAGLIMALAEGFPALQPLAQAIRPVFNDASPAVLINAGLVGIGLRGALST